MPLEWVTDAAFRFFPTQPDELFGYVLHPVDLATKATPNNERIFWGWVADYFAGPIPLRRRSG
jgi:hypothetical protein